MPYYFNESGVSVFSMVCGEQYLFQTKVPARLNNPAGPFSLFIIIIIICFVRRCLGVVFPCYGYIVARECDDLRTDL